MSVWEKLVNKLYNEKQNVNAKDAQEAMLLINRMDFIPNEKMLPFIKCTQISQIDRPLGIGFGQTISAPHMHFETLYQLRKSLVKGNKVLDIGCGSGYLLACFAYLVQGENSEGNHGSVVGIELVNELVTFSQENLYKYKNFIDLDIIKIYRADGKEGCRKHTPYNAIHVGATTTIDVAKELAKQLTIDGILMAPINIRTGVTKIIIIKRFAFSKYTYKFTKLVRYVDLV